MSTCAIAMVKDEADVIGTTVANMLEQCDHVLVADNGSTDGTRDILADLGVDVIDDPDPAYYQSRKMSRLARWADDLGHDWVVPFDADEMWYSPFGRIADVLIDQPEAVATAALYDHVPTGIDEPDPDLVRSIRWRRVDPAPLVKVAARTAKRLIVHQGNHGAGYPDGTVDGLLVVRHYPYRSVDQFVSKVRNGAAAYKATNLPEHAGAHWRQYGQLLDGGGPDAIAEVFRTWFWVADPRDHPDLINDPCPRLS